MKRLTLTGLALFFVATLSAQVEDDWTGKVKESNESAFKEYEQFKQQAYQDYLSFRRQANEEFAKFMEESWKMYDIQPAEEPPAKPKPVTPMVDNTVPTKPEPKPTLDPEPKLEPETEPEPKPEPEIKPEPEPKLEPEPEPVLEPEPKPEPEPEPKPEPAPEQNTNVRQAVAPVRIPDPIQVQDLSKPELMLTGRPQPVEPIVPSAVPMVAAQNVYLYGSFFAFHIDSEPTLSLKDASEKSVAKMWKQLSDPSFDYIIAECLQQRDKRQLCDWAYIKLTQSVAEKQFGAGTNEAVVMQMYLLTQSGYQMRIGRDDANRLALLIGSKEKIYYYKYFMLNGMKFYLIDRSFNKKGLSIFDHAFPKERSLSLAMIQPDLQIDKTEKRTIKSKRYPNVSVTVQTNRNLISFYNEYPMSAMWNYYSLASLSNVVKETLYPALRQAIKGKTELEAANIILNFVQTGFEYKTDDEQFGYERPLYPDESLFYPYCDCEDRSILFSCLIRELLGLDVVLLNYPEHLATAVSFNEEVKGDYLVIDGKSYIICDPTYINASVGNCAPKYKTVSPAIVRF